MKKGFFQILFLLSNLVFVVLVLGSCYPKHVGYFGSNLDRITWPEMSLEQKKAHMAEVVLPRPAPVFRLWRPERFTLIDCTLCHGPGASEGRYRMPSAHLPRLSGAVLLGPEFEKYPDTTSLKLNRLVPVMSESLGLRKFSIITRRGFGCYSCHLGPDGPMFVH
jgi:hypothetical protein